MCSCVVFYTHLKARKFGPGFLGFENIGHKASQHSPDDISLDHGMDRLMAFFSLRCSVE